MGTHENGHFIVIDSDTGSAQVQYFDHAVENDRRYEATLTYTVPMPSDGAMSESASVLDFVKSGPPDLTKSRTFTLRFRLEL